MKTLDLLILVPLLWGAYNGYKKGLMMSIIAIIAFVLAVILGFKLLDVGLKWLAPHFSGNNKFLPYFAFGIIFFPIILLVNKLGQMLHKSIQYTLLGSFDSMAGALIGIFTWAFGVSVFFWLIHAIGVNMPNTATGETFIYPVVSSIAPNVINKASALFPLGENLVDSIKYNLKKLSS